MIPTYEEIMLPFLNLLSDGREHSLNEAHDKLADHFQLTEGETRELLPSGQQPVFRNRIGWARTYLKKAGLLTSPRRAHFVITDRGRALLKENPKEITSNFLKRYEEFVEFQTIKRDKPTKGADQKELFDQFSDQTPEEALKCLAKCIGLSRDVVQHGLIAGPCRPLRVLFISNCCLFKV